MTKRNFDGTSRNAGFSAYLRTGRLIVSMWGGSGIEAKFNRWHDREDGKFTFSGTGQYFGAGAGAASNPSSAQMAKRPTDKDLLRRSLDRAKEVEMADAERGRADRQRQRSDPRNYTQYVVRPGDSLTRIAKTRRNLSVDFLAEVNGIADPNLVRSGQVLRIPKQPWLDDIEDRAERLRRFEFYYSRHGMPPFPRTPEEASRMPRVDLAHLPSIEEQIASDLETFSANGYTFQGDPYDRVPARASGKLQFGTRGKRSKKEQLNAGGNDRRPTDHGGHLVGSWFNGPREWFNHFAQDARFNNGEFKKLEVGWDKLGKAGHEIFVDIRVHRKGASKRPYEVLVMWQIDGGPPMRRKFRNEAGGK